MKITRWLSNLFSKVATEPQHCLPYYDHFIVSDPSCLSFESCFEFASILPGDRVRVDFQCVNPACEALHTIMGTASMDGRPSTWVLSEVAWYDLDDVDTRLYGQEAPEGMRVIITHEGPCYVIHPNADGSPVEITIRKDAEPSYNVN